MRLREPFSGLSHLGGALLGIAALVVLVSLARGKPWHVSGFAIYGSTLIILYMASALYHLLHSLSQEERRKVLDELLAWVGAGPVGRPTHRTLTLDEVIHLDEGELARVL